MDSDQYVPITTVANLDHVKKLSTDMNLIVEVLRCKYTAVWADSDLAFRSHSRLVLRYLTTGRVVPHLPGFSGPCGWGGASKGYIPQTQDVADHRAGVKTGFCRDDDGWDVAEKYSKCWCLT